MNWEDARQTIYNALITPWNTAHNTATIFLPGQGAPDLNSRTAPFLMFSVQPQGARQSGMSSPSVRPIRRFGRIEALIFVPEMTSAKTVISMLTTLEGLFTARSISGIVLHESTTPDEVTAVSWTRQPYLVGFHFDNLG